MATSGSPSFTTSPVETRTWLTTPATSARTGISIFIDSKMATESSAATASPTSTSTLNTAATSSATTVWVMGVMLEVEADNAGSSAIRASGPSRGHAHLARLTLVNPPAAKSSLKVAPKAPSWAYAEDFLAESEIATAARANAVSLGIMPIGRGGATALTFVAQVIQARAVVEIGTGSGVSGLALFAGMQPGGILTSVDIEAEHQAAARRSFLQLGVASQRFRLINGAALNVLPRLSDGAYDLVFVDGDKLEYPQYVEQGLRLLRHGGVLAVDNALWHDRVADPANTDEQTEAIREAVSAIGENEDLVPALLPVGDGLLLAVKR